MIIKFNLFETVNKDEPKIGDYALCKVRRDQTGTSFEPYVSLVNGLPALKADE